MNCKVCGKTSAKNSSVSFFRFPKESTKCRDWAKRCDLLDLYEKHGTLRFYKSFRICSDHFSLKDVVFDGRKNRLLQCAAPMKTVGLKQKKKEENLQKIDQSDLMKPNLVNNLCRLCAKKDKNLTEIFNVQGKEFDFEEKLKYLPLMINKYDFLPQKVCHQCVLKVNGFYDFIQNCIKAETKLKIILNLKDYTATHQFPKSEVESKEKLDRDSGIEETSFNDVFKTHNSANLMPCLQNLTYNHCDHLFKNNLDNTKDINFYYQEDLSKTNQLLMNTNLSKQIDFSKSISFEHDYSNFMVMNHSQSEFQTINQNLTEELKFSCNDSEEGSAQYFTNLLKSKCERESSHEPDDKASCSRSKVENQVFQQPEESYVCKICDKKFHEVAFFEKHLMEHQLETPSFKNFRIIGETDIKNQVKRAKESLKCNFSVRNVKQLWLKSEQRCRFCEKSFKSLSVCLAHERIHSGETRHRCNQCRKLFRSKASLRQHRAVHSEKRMHNCHECGMSFKRKDTLGNHLRIHTGERPFICKICGFAFKQRGDCMKHEKNHKESTQRISGNGILRKEASITHHQEKYSANASHLDDKVLRNEKRNSSSLEGEEVASSHALRQIGGDPNFSFQF